MKRTQKGFTLVELAIVMTIIGLLIGGILKGQELMQNARVTSTIAQVRAYEAATTTFRDKYDAMPGDMANAAARIPGCTANCNPAAGAAATGVSGDGVVGLLNWAWATQTLTTTAVPATVQYETMLYWSHLLLSDLISGVTNAAISAGNTSAWGETHPAAKIGGGFVAGFGNGTITPGSSAAAGSGPAGTLLALVRAPNTAAAAMSTAGQQPITPSRAAQIDRKMDDGRPDGGYVQAYGLTTSCFSVAAPFSAASPGYLESITTNDCGLVFRIQG